MSCPPCCSQNSPKLQADVAPNLFLSLRDAMLLPGRCWRACQTCQLSPGTAMEPAQRCACRGNLPLDLVHPAYYAKSSLTIKLCQRFLLLDGCTKKDFIRRSISSCSLWRLYIHVTPSALHAIPLRKQEVSTQLPLTAAV